MVVTIDLPPSASCRNVDRRCMAVVASRPLQHTGKNFHTSGPGPSRQSRSVVLEFSHIGVALWATRWADRWPVDPVDGDHTSEVAP